MDENEIVELGKEISKLADSLTIYINQYEAKFNAMDLKVRTWIKLGDSDAMLGYDKINGKFALCYRYTRESETIPLKTITLSERYGAAIKLAELEANHIKHATKFAKNLRKFLSGGDNGSGIDSPEPEVEKGNSKQ